MAEQELAWLWPKDCRRPPRGMQLGFWPVEWGIWFPARRLPWWRRWRRR